MNTILYRNASDFDPTATPTSLKNGHTVTPVLTIFGLLLSPAVYNESAAYKGYVTSPDDTVAMPLDKTQRDEVLKSAAVLAKMNTAMYANITDCLITAAAAVQA